MAKKKNNNSEEKVTAFPKASKANVAAFLAKVGIANVDESISPVSFIHVRPNMKYEVDITKHTFAYNEHSKKEYINRADGFEASVENAENSMLLFPMRLRNRPDLIARYCDIPIPEEGDYEVPCLQAEVIKQADGTNKIRFKFAKFHPYVNLIFEVVGDCIIDPNGKGKNYKWTSLDKSKQ